MEEAHHCSPDEKIQGNRIANLMSFHLTNWVEDIKQQEPWKKNIQHYNGLWNKHLSDKKPIKIYPKLKLPNPTSIINFSS